MNTYYEQLEPLLWPNVKSRFSDLAEFDQETLNSYKGAFIHAHNTEAMSLDLLVKKSLSDVRRRELTESALFDSKSTLFILEARDN